MFEWKSEFSVNIVSIDAQHQTLFRLAEDLYQAMSRGQAKQAMAKILDRLVQYTTMHFAHEERLLKLHRYPDFAAHQAEHEALTARVRQFQADFQSGKVNMTVQVLHFLKDWLEKHIKHSDQRYSPFLKQRAVA